MDVVWLCAVAMRNPGTDMASGREAPFKGSIETSSFTWGRMREAGYWGWVDYNLIVEAKDRKEQSNVWAVGRSSGCNSGKA